MSNTDDLTRLESWVTPLLAKLQPAERRQLARKVATALRRSQQRRIARQQNPDGTAYAPRRAQSRQGRIKRKAMFVKLRQVKFMKASSDPGGVSVGFMGRVSRIARVHQLGLNDQASPGGADVNYQRRELLGFSSADLELTESMLLEHLSEAGAL